MADTQNALKPQVVFKAFEDGDIVAAKAKIKYFPAWSDVSSDVDTNQQATINTFYLKGSQATGSIEGYYYWNVYQENPTIFQDTSPQFAIAFGQTSSATQGTPASPAGVWNVDIVTSNPLGLGQEYYDVFPAWAIYRQIVNVATNGDAYTNLTYINENGTSITMGNIVVVAFERARVKDYIDPNTWQLNLSGTLLIPLTAQTASSANQTAYNVIIGTASGYTGNQGVPSQNYGRSCGRFYSDKGLIVLDADYLFNSGAFSPYTLGKLRSSLFGCGASSSATNYYTSSLILGTITSAIVGTGQTSVVSATASVGYTITGSGDSYFKARSVERVQSTHYFVRAKNNEFNNTTNPTWVSGSEKTVQSIFFDDPKTFITSVGLYDGFPGQDNTGQLVAIAKMSKPVPKDSTTEALVKVRLDY